MRWEILLICVSTVGLIAQVPDRDHALARPNVILMMCDDLGWGDVGFNGSKVVKTPHLDALAGESLRFERFYAAAPVCSPTRGSVLTGRHPYRYGITGANVGHMKGEEFTLAEALGSLGYATGHFGKWHLGTLTTAIRDSNRGAPGKAVHFAPPWRNGFEVCFSTEAKVPTWDPMRVPKKFGPGQSRRYGWIPVEEAAETQPYGTHYWSGPGDPVTEGLEGDDSRVIMDRALSFIEGAANKGQPFFAVIWFHTPHLPVVAGKKHRAPYAERSLKEQLYYGCISAMDEQVGRLWAQLEQSGVAGETMWWFASDNGPERGTPGSPGPFRGRKRSLYEGGVRVPALLHWPARVPEGRTTDLPCVTSDYLPTVLAVLGHQREGQPDPLDGISLLPLIAGRMRERPCPIGFQSAKMATWSDNRFKLVVKRTEARPELYDLVADLTESRDLAEQHPSVVQRMQRELAAWKNSCGASARGGDYE